MKARLNGTKDPFVEIKEVSLADKPYVVYDANRIEFEQQQEPTSDHWQDLRERAAIAVLPQCLKIVQDVLWRGGSLTEDTIAKQAATNAVDYADALVKKLKGE